MAEVEKLESSTHNRKARVSPVYEGHEFEALKLQYETQTSLLRTLTDIDLRIFTGYITVQLLLGGWLTQYLLCSLWLRIGILVIDLTLCGIAAWLLNNNYMRRREVSATVRNLNEALGYTDPDIYLQGKALNAATVFRPWVHGYRVGIITAAIAIIVIIFGR